MGTTVSHADRRAEKQTVTLHPICTDNFCKVFIILAANWEQESVADPDLVETDAFDCDAMPAKSASADGGFDILF